MPLVEAHASGESPQTLHSPGVQQRCEAKGEHFQCEGVIPEEEGSFLPGHEENCDYAAMTINGQGRITEETAEPIQRAREAFHADIACRL